MKTKHCSYCDFTPCRCSKEEVKDKWMSFEQYQFERDWYNKREQELLRGWGLGWIAEFCSKPKTDELQDIHTEPKQLPDS